MVVAQDGAGPIHSVIIADDTAGTRNIFFDGRRVAGPPMAAITAELVGSADILMVDHAIAGQALAACRIARQLRVVTVADIEGEPTPGKDELMAVVDHLIVPASFAAAATGASPPHEMAHILSRMHRRQCTAVTCGREGCFYVMADGAAGHQPAFQVPAVDTTGCGDVFHGAYAWALSRGLGIDRCVLAAAAAAAEFAARPAGWANLPSPADVARIIKRGVES
jgi:sugar/nucleoside kinase (ribokinase family)